MEDVVSNLNFQIIPEAYIYIYTVYSVYTYIVYIHTLGVSENVGTYELQVHFQLFPYEKIIATLDERTRESSCEIHQRDDKNEQNVIFLSNGDFHFLT